MVVPAEKFNPHERAPCAVRELYNECRCLDPSQVDAHPRILDLQELDKDQLPDGLFLDHSIPQSSLELALDEFMGSSSWRAGIQDGVEDACVYGIKQVPGT